MPSVLLCNQHNLLFHSMLSFPHQIAHGMKYSNTSWGILHVLRITSTRETEGNKISATEGKYNTPTQAINNTEVYT